MEESRTTEPTQHQDPYTVAEIAAKVRVSRKTIYAEIAAGTLAALKIGDTFRVEPPDYEAWRLLCRARAVRPIARSEMAS